MSLLSINRTTIFLSPAGAFSLVRSRFGQGGLRLAAHRDSAASHGHVSDPDFAGLQALLHAQGNGPVEIVLSNHYVRYQLFPWQENLQNLREELGFARFAFTQTYGGVVEGWTVSLSDEAPGQARIAAAVDTALLDRLSADVKSAGGELVSVATSLVTSLSYWRGEFEARQPVWFMTHDNGLLTLVLRDHRGWRWVRSRRVAEGWLAGWRQIIADETLMLGEELGAVRALLFAPGCISPKPLEQGGLALTSLELDAQMEKSALKDNRYAFAWVA